MNNSFRFYFYVLMLFPVLIYALSSDTTKSDTRLILKEKKEQKKKSIKDKEIDKYNSVTNNKDDDNDSGDCDLAHWIIKEIFKFILVKPAKAFFFNDANIDDFSNNKFRLGLALSILDFYHYPKAAYGYSVKLSSDFLYNFNEYISLREHISVHNSPLGILKSDFERNVFVDGNLIGTEKDKGDSYKNLSLSFNTEIMLRTTGKNGSFYLLLGSGPRYVNEKLEGIREYSFKNNKKNITVEQTNWIPSISFGIGKFVQNGKPFFSIELRYSISFNNNTKNRSLPADNTEFVHGFTFFQYQIFF